MSGRKTIGFSVYISQPTQVKATPSVRSVENSFDNISDQVSLKRIQGESNVDYRNRLMDVAVHPSGPLYEGVVNGIARDLGMLRSPSLRIDLAVDSGGQPLAPSPRVDVLPNKIIFYSDWRPDGTSVIDQEIRTYKLGDAGYYLDDLVAQINTSTYFTGAIIAGTRPNTITSTLVRKTSNRIVQNELVRADQLTELAYRYIVRGSMVFTDKAIFETEVTIDPAADGEYRVDYIEGDIYAYNTPSGESTCTYYAAVFPLDIDSVPIQIFTFQSDDFQQELFDQHTLDSGEDTNGLPNAEGAEIFHQLFMESDVFWGN